MTMNHLGQPIGAPLPDWKPPPTPPRLPLEGRWCRLEPLDPDRHAEALFTAFAADPDGRSWTYLAYGPFATLADYRNWMNASCRGDDPLFFAITTPLAPLGRGAGDEGQPACTTPLTPLGRGAGVEGRPLGVASYLRIFPTNGSIEVGHIHYAPILQRTPAATEAMFLMMQQAFDLGYRRYEWKCDALNAASRAAALRLGFSFEGIFRQATVYKGRNRDTAWYAVLDHEWPNLRAAFQTWLDPSNFDSAGRQHQRLSACANRILAARTEQTRP